MDKISRSEARSKNLKFYFTGKQCVNGHITKRQVSNGCCYQCTLNKSREYARNNKSKRKEYRRKNAEQIKRSSTIYNAKNKSKRKEYRRKNAEQIKRSVKKYYNENLENIKEYKKQWYLDNKNKTIEYSRNRYARVKDDPDFKISKVMRQMLRRVLLLTGAEKTTNTEVVLGYTKKELMIHLESMFKDGMCWDNYGEWHIDHVVPIAEMLKLGVKEPELINSLDNLQPLWASDNLSKGSKC